MDLLKLEELPQVAFASVVWDYGYAKAKTWLYEEQPDGKYKIVKV